jgi:hypothetical protein
MTYTAAANLVAGKLSVLRSTGVGLSWMGKEQTGSRLYSSAVVRLFQEMKAKYSTRSIHKLPSASFSQNEAQKKY